MRKLVLLNIIFLAIVACHTKPGAPIYKAGCDTVYNNGSGIQTFVLDSEKIYTLTNLGMVWGFIKYYHAFVNRGNFNMDAELFRILPKILAAPNINEANIIIERWVDHFGIPDTCKNCKEVPMPSNTKLKPDYGYLFDKDNFPQSLISKIEFIKENTDSSWLHYYIEMVQSAGNPVFTHELTYRNNVYPDAGLRLLSLYRYWNMIQYFYPDRHLIGEDWNKVLMEFIPVFCKANDTLAYQLACLQLIARIHDTHAQLEGARAIDKMKGDYYMPFTTAFIENNLVILDCDPNLKAMFYEVRRGDIIEKIDGVPVDSLIKKYLPLTPASNYSTQLSYMSGPSGWLVRGCVPDVHLQITRYGFSHDVMLQRSESGGKSNQPYTNSPLPSSIIEGNIGYIYPAILDNDSIDSLKIKFKDTKGIIIDMRCYPGAFMPYTYGAWLKPGRSPFVVASTFSVVMPGWFGLTDTFYNGGNTGDYYNGKLVIIVNQQTLSQAEFTTMALSTVPQAFVIGDTTAGADGNVSVIELPGGLTTWISGIGELYPDGTESQRKGVKIDRIVKPTIKGIQEGRDELLEYAIRLINEK